MPFQGQERCSYLEVNSSPPRIIFPDCNPLTFQSCLGGLWMLLINLNKGGQGVGPTEELMDNVLIGALQRLSPAPGIRNPPQCVVVPSSSPGKLGQCVGTRRGCFQQPCGTSSKIESGSTSTKRQNH
uniref:Uncharacterized protein n=1 Tax=Molossus molossus TaxID=27622 RepID=A0A7J8F985_MOLMO|nr:hypothetical protein HJG59_008497 [Molossus molossus]